MRRLALLPIILTSNTALALSWSAIDTVTTASSPDQLHFAFNNTPICAHDSAGFVHLAYDDDSLPGEVQVLTDDCGGGAWCTNAIPAINGGSAVIKPTLVAGAKNADRMLAAWVEETPSGRSVAAAHSDDGGTTWVTTTIAAYPEGQPSNVTIDLMAGRSVEGGGTTELAVACWELKQGANQDIPCATWRGNDWITDVTAWSSPVQVSSSGVAQNPSVASRLNRAVVAWDEPKGATQALHAARWRAATGVWSALGYWTDGNDPSLAYSPTGELFIGFHHLGLLFVTDSTDNGNTVSMPTLVDNGSFAQVRVLPTGADLAVGFEYGILYNAQAAVAHYSYAGGTFTKEDQEVFGSVGVTRPSVCIDDGPTIDLFYIDGPGAPSQSMYHVLGN